MSNNYPYKKPQYQNHFRYGYTLGAPTEQTRGAYAVYNEPLNLPATPAGQTQGSSTYKLPPPPPGEHPRSWADIKRAADLDPFSNADYKAKVFVTSASSMPLSAATTWSSSSCPPPVVTTFYPAPVASIVNAGDTNVKKEFSDAPASSSCAQLCEIAQGHNIPLSYEDRLEEHKGMTTTYVTLRLGTETYVGTGTCLANAKDNAALQALMMSAYVKLAKTMTLRPRTQGLRTSTSELYELAAKKGLKVECVFLEPYNFNYQASMHLRRDELRGNYRVQIKIAGQEFFGTADFPQDAKHNAALDAIPYVRNLPESTPTASAVVEVIQPTNSSDQMMLPGGIDTGGKNPLMFLNEIAMSRNMSLDWIPIQESGASHMRTFTWMLKLGSYESVGTGSNKKIAKMSAATNMLQGLPPELLAKPAKPPKLPNYLKRKFGASGIKEFSAPLPVASSSVVPVTPPPSFAMPNAPVPPTASPVIGPQAMPPPPGVGSSKSVQPMSGQPVHAVIFNSNPISALHEFCRKAKLPEPDFDCVSETVLETWQKGSQTFKKVEYTMRLQIMGKTHFASANSKKAAKTNVANVAWNIIRAGTFP